MKNKFIERGENYDRYFRYIGFYYFNVCGFLFFVDLFLVKIVKGSMLNVGGIEKR